MLGFERKRTPITGEFAKNIREQVERINRAQLNEQDCNAIRQNRQITSQNIIIWK